MIPTLFHPFPAILSYPKAGEMDLDRSNRVWELKHPQTFYLLTNNTVRVVRQAGWRRGTGHWVPIILWTLQPGVQSHSGQLLDEHSQDPRDPVHSQSQHHKHAGREFHG